MCKHSAVAVIIGVDERSHLIAVGGGPGGEDLGHVYRESEAGKRNSAVGEVLSWPIIKPVAMIKRQLSGTTSSAPWRTFAAAAFYANSLAWGMGLWLLLEMLARGVYRVLRRLALRRKVDQPDPAPGQWTQ